jgi:hypothetical protein
MKEEACHHGNLLRRLEKLDCDLNCLGTLRGGQPETMRRGFQVKLAGNEGAGSRREGVERMRDDDGNGNLIGFE